MPSTALLKLLAVDESKGLTETEVSQRLKRYGENRVGTKKSYSIFKLFLHQFRSPLIYMLLFAAFLSLLLYDSTDAFIIIGIMLISTLLSSYQEKDAERTMEKLLQIVQIKTTVLRNGVNVEIPLEQIVPGDIIKLSAGDIIPGDCYILDSKDLFVDESAFTGETFYTEKIAKTSPNNAPLSKRSNELFMGTHVVSGTATALVVFTGKESEFGKLSSRLAVEMPKTEFETGVYRFGYFLMEVTFVLLFAIFSLNVFFHRPVIESILFALSLSVGLTPQLLPAIITINLAYGAKQMASQQVIVKKLTCIENLGSMNILCADKTGTLTTGKIQLSSFLNTQGQQDDQVLLFASLNAKFQNGYRNPIDQAILLKAHEISADWTKLDEIPYDFIRKRVSVLLQTQGTNFIITKGAFKQMIEICSSISLNDKLDALSHQQIKNLNKLYSQLSKKGYRVLGLAYKETTATFLPSSDHECEMTFLGLLIFEDPLKSNVKQTIDHLSHLGVSLKIITGDNRFVAEHVGESLGIESTKILTGSQLALLSDRALFHQVNAKTIFAEIEPYQKERIILALRKSGHVVGFIGDGINDVTALHASDVSISVDTASDAAKEAAHIVLMKQDLSVLKEGVLAGRKTFVNTLKYIFMASSANFGNMFSMSLASLFLPFLPLLPKQILLNNLLTDFPEMSIATDQVDVDRIEKPLRWNIRFIRNFMIVFGLISSIFDFLTFGILIFLNTNVQEFRTAWFVESVVSATLIILVIRTFHPFFTSVPSRSLLGMVCVVILSALAIPFLPFMRTLGFSPISLKIYLFIFLIVSLYVVSAEFAKKIFMKYSEH